MCDAQRYTTATSDRNTHRLHNQHTPPQPSVRLSLPPSPPFLPPFLPPSHPLSPSLTLCHPLSPSLSHTYYSITHTLSKPCTCWQGNARIMLRRRGAGTCSASWEEVGDGGWTRLNLDLQETPTWPRCVKTLLYDSLLVARLPRCRTPRCVGTASRARTPARPVLSLPCVLAWPPHGADLRSPMAGPPNTLLISEVDPPSGAHDACRAGASQRAAPTAHHSAVSAAAARVRKHARPQTRARIHARTRTRA